MKKRVPTPPYHLSTRCKAWWKSVVRDFELEDHHLHLLRLCAEALDRCEEARAILGEDGITFRDDRGNVRSHPAVQIEKDARIAVARLLRELSLDADAAPDAPRPVRTSDYGRRR
jgi:P27 family predicted phage terminase small subunit